MLKFIKKRYNLFSKDHKDIGMLNLVFGGFLGIVGTMFIFFFIMVSIVYVCSEYLYLEEFMVHAMKKSRLFLGNDLLHFNKSISGEIVSRRFVNFSKFIQTNSLVSNPASLFSTINTSWLSSSKELLEYKAQFSTYKNNRVFNSIGDLVVFPANLYFKMDLNYIKSYIYYVDKDIFVYLKDNMSVDVFNNLCKSFKKGFDLHGALVIYDKDSNKFLIGIGTHSSNVYECLKNQCGLESKCYTIMENIDFKGNLGRSQNIRNFIVFENEQLNSLIFEYLKQKNVVIFENENLKIDEIVKLVNKNTFTYIDNQGSVYFNNASLGELLHCCSISKV